MRQPQSFLFTPTKTPSFAGRHNPFVCAPTGPLRTGSGPALARGAGSEIRHAGMLTAGKVYDIWQINTAKKDKLLHGWRMCAREAGKAARFCQVAAAP